MQKVVVIRKRECQTGFGLPRYGCLNCAMYCQFFFFIRVAMERQVAVSIVDGNMGELGVVFKERQHIAF